MRKRYPRLTISDRSAVDAATNDIVRVRGLRLIAHRHEIGRSMVRRYYVLDGSVS